VYRAGIENWLVGLLQPVIDDLKKPDYVQRVEIKQFSLGDEPLSVRNVERKTSRRANDLQYVYTCLVLTKFSALINCWDCSYLVSIVYCFATIESLDEIYLAFISVRVHEIIFI